MEDQNIDFVKIKEARDEINRILEERPEYKPFQEMIDRELAKAGKNHDNRMAVLNNLLWAKMKELHVAMTQLQDECNKASRLAAEVKRIKDEEEKQKN